jgi:hypothetical protein
MPPDIPPDADLIFEVELVAIGDKHAPPRPIAPVPSSTQSTSSSTIAAAPAINEDTSGSEEDEEEFVPPPAKKQKREPPAHLKGAALLKWTLVHAHMLFTCT